MLEIIHAGAGSGKTRALCEIAVERIVAGMHPQRLLATTFTRRAAAELKQRIAASLLSCETLSPDERLQRVSQLDGALVGTVHSVAHQLVTRHAFSLRLSPRLRVIDESTTRRSMRTVLGSLPPEPWEELSAMGRQMGIERLEQLVLQLLAAKRDNLIDGDAFRRQMRASAQRVCELCADGQEVVDGGFQRLRELVGEALAALEELGEDGTQVTEKARTALRRMAHDPSPQWRCFLDAAKLNAGKKSGADAMLEPVRRYARDVRYQRCLHEAIPRFIELLTEQTLQLERNYGEHKRTAGQVDFTDLERLFLQLLESPAERTRLSSDVELVLVDEFQDTSPLQLAIFSRLREIATETHWVGDEKQAIYGFRGTDPQLVRRVWNHLGPAPDHQTPADALAESSGRERQATGERVRIRNLQKNYRSAAGLVTRVGRLFRDVLGPEAEQTPVGRRSGRIERWLIESKNRDTDLQCLAGGIKALMQDGGLAGDIAVLARSGDRLKGIAAALEAQGVASRLEQPGLMKTREGALMMAGLRVVADRLDSLASATVCHLLADPDDGTPGWLEERIEEIRSRDSLDTCEMADETRELTIESRQKRLPWEGHPVLSRLRQIDHRSLSPTAVAVEVIEALHLGKHRRRWGDPARRAGGIDRLLHFAQQYEVSASDAGEPPTLSGLIHYFDELEAAGDDLRLSPADEEAVTLLTYHRAKGLEFSTVVLFDLDHDRLVGPWGISVTGGGAVKEPTRDRVLRFWPWPFGRNPKNGNLLTGSGVESTARQATEGREAEQAGREESLRLLYVGCTRACERLVLAHRLGQSAWLDQLPEADRLLPCEEATEPSDTAEEVACECVVRRLAPENLPVADGRDLATWFEAGKPGRAASPATAGWHTPSRQSPSGSETIQVEATGGSAFFPAAKAAEDFRRIGDSVHAYFAALPSLSGCGDLVRRQCAFRCLERHSATEWLSDRWLVDAGEAFRKWTSQRWPGGQWTCEIPFTATRAAGGYWRGVADLVIWLGGTRIVLIDHKATPLRVEDCAAEAATHAGQIAASLEALSEAGLNVVASYLHFPMAGRVVQVRF